MPMGNVIQKVRGFYFPLKLHGVLHAAYGSVECRNIILLEITTLDGAVFYGEGTNVYARRANALQEAMEELHGVFCSLCHAGITLESLSQNLDDVFLNPMSKSTVSIALNNIGKERIPVDVGECYVTALSCSDDDFSSIYNGVQNIKLKLNGSNSVDQAYEFLVFKNKIDGLRCNVSIDANRTLSFEDAQNAISRFSEISNVHHLEDPFGSYEECAAFHEYCGIPIVADETVLSSDDAAYAMRFVQGVNVKATKFASIPEMLRTIQCVQRLGGRYVLGCDYNTQLALLPVLELVKDCFAFEFDAPLLVINDPFRGLLNIQRNGTPLQSIAEVPNECFEEAQLVWEVRSDTKPFYHLLGSQIKCLRSMEQKQFYVDKVRNTFSSNQKLLDVGCGDGWLQSVLTDWDIIGIDRSEDLIAIAEQNGAKVICSDILDANFGQNKFDGVVCLWAVLNEATNETEALKVMTKLRQCLNDGGVCLVDAPYISEDYLTYHGTRVINGFVELHVNGLVIDQLVISPEMMRWLFASAGFQYIDVHIERSDAWPYPRLIGMGQRKE
ncbi:methyltransferase domain-containing protein [Candidatus Parcubacteria bacterium]|nr:MAG: methyltransferase domain-containing protein [Candidatus Parcubacteria bacterium]